MKELTRQDQGKVCEHCAYVGGRHDARICRKNAPGKGAWAKTTDDGYCGDWYPSDGWMDNRESNMKGIRKWHM